MLYRLTPLTGRLQERWQLRRNLPSGFHTTAERSWIISPSVEKRVPPAIYFPEDLQRITGVAPDGNTIERQIARAHGGVEQHFATTAYLLKNVVLAEGHLYSHRMVYRFGFHPVPAVAPSCNRRIDSAVLATSSYGVKYFGHWMTDDLPLGLAAQALGQPVSTLRNPTHQQTGYLKLMNLDFERVENVRFDQIVLLEDFAQNEYKSARYAELRTRARAIDSPLQNSCVMLLRGSTGERRTLENEAEVAEMVKRRGFKVIDPSVVNASEIVRCCLDAKIVLGVEGSQLANGLMWMDSCGTLVVIQPPSRFNIGHKDRCDAESIRFAFVVGESLGGQSFRVDLSQLQRLLDRVC